MKAKKTSAKKKKPVTLETLSHNVDKLADIVVRGFEEVHEKFDTMQDQIDTMQGQIGTIQGQVGTIQGQVGTIQRQIETMQEHILNIETDIKSIKVELAYINRRLDSLEEATRDMRGYAKEIDDLRARVKYLENLAEQQSR